MLELQLTKPSQKFLKKLLPKHVRQLKEKISSLQLNPEPQDSKKLTGCPFHRVDVGEYRIIYRWGSQILQIYLIGKRNDDEVYKRLGRIRKL